MKGMSIMDSSKNTKIEASALSLDHVSPDSNRADPVNPTDTVKVLIPNPKLRNGSRYRRLQRLGRWLVAAGCTDLLGVLRGHNEFHCQPLLDDHEVQQIVAALDGSALTGSPVAGEVQ